MFTGNGVIWDRWKMRIDELKRIAKENDYEYEADRMKHQFKRQTRRIGISRKDEKTLWITSNSYCDDKDFNMIKAAVEFAETPVSDRELDMKNYLVHKFMRGGNNLSYPGYLMQCYDVNLMYIGNDVVDGRSFSDNRKTFTMEEIEKIKKENNTKLKDFYIIPDTDKNRRLLFSINCEADFNIEDFEFVEVEE